MLFEKPDRGRESLRVTHGPAPRRTKAGRSGSVGAGGEGSGSVGASGRGQLLPPLPRGRGIPERHRRVAPVARPPVRVGRGCRTLVGEPPVAPRREAGFGERGGPDLR